MANESLEDNYKFFNVYISTCSTTGQVGPWPSPLLGAGLYCTKVPQEQNVK